jgi:hypothetical protein
MRPILLGRPAAISNVVENHYEKYPKFYSKGSDRFFTIGQSKFLATPDYFNQGKWNIYSHTQGGFYADLGIPSVEWENINEATVLAVL